VRLDVTENGRAVLRADSLGNLFDAVNRLSTEEREALAKGLVALHQQLQRQRP
jgi:hypothetical protein